jgi:hypothetical protein
LDIKNPDIKEWVKSIITTQKQHVPGDITRQQKRASKIKWYTGSPQHCHFWEKKKPLKE